MVDMKRQSRPLARRGTLRVLLIWGAGRGGCQVLNNGCKATASSINITGMFWRTG